jgi:hypothetical protein
LVEGEGSILVVESAAPNAAGGVGMLGSLAEGVWRGRAKDVEKALVILEQRWGQNPDILARQHAELTPIPVREAASVQIDERAVSFDVLRQPHRWAGRARVDGYDVTLESQDWPIEGLALVQIKDLEPYIPRHAAV